MLAPLSGSVSAGEPCNPPTPVGRDLHATCSELIRNDKNLNLCRLRSFPTRNQQVQKLPAPQEIGRNSDGATTLAWSARACTLCPTIATSLLKVAASCIARQIPSLVRNCLILPKQLCLSGGDIEGRGFETSGR